MRFTDQAVRAAISRARQLGKAEWLHEGRGRGAGALSLKAGAGGRGHWYFRYSLDRKQQYVPIGQYGDEPGEWSLKAARDECGRLDVLRAQAPGGDLRGQKAVQEAARVAEHRAQVQAVVEAPKLTVSALLDTYADHLEARGKRATAQDVRGLARLHVAGAFPAYADAPARDFTARQAVELLRRLVEAGKGRTAAKLRAYMRAAYALAMRAESDAAAPSRMLAFRIDANPIAATATLPQFNRTGDRNLSEAELRALWKRLERTDTPSSLAIRLSLLLGGQRFSQLLRARAADFDREAATLTLYDPKGRRAEPRAHVLPLPPAALAIVKERLALAAMVPSEWLFPAENGSSATANTVSKFLQPLRAAMVKTGEARDFELGDMRRTCETLLAALGVSKDIRAQIQSHGLGGVQARHYDRFEYLPQKRAALDAWANWITDGTIKNVVPIEKKRRPRRVAA